MSGWHKHGNPQLVRFPKHGILLSIVTHVTSLGMTGQECFHSCMNLLFDKECIVLFK